MPASSNACKISRLMMSFTSRTPPFLHKKTYGQLQPIVGQSIVDPWLQFVRGDSEQTFHLFPLRVGQCRSQNAVPPCDLQDALLSPYAVGGVSDRQAHLLPEVRKVASVVVDRFLEYLVIGHGHHAASVLPAANPRRSIRIRVRRRLANLQDRGLDEIERDRRRRVRLP